MLPAASPPCCHCPTRGTPRNSTSCARSAQTARSWQRSPPAGSRPRQPGSGKPGSGPPSAASQISGELERLAAERPAPDEVRPWWGTIVQWLARDPEKFNEHRAPVHLDLTVAPSCPAPGSPLRAALQAAALHAVGQAPVMTAAGISRVVDFADACEVTALYLSLFGTPANLAPERWAGLALVLAFANCDAIDDEPALLPAQARGRPGRAPPSPRRCPRLCRPSHRGGPRTSSPRWRRRPSATRQTRRCLPGRLPLTGPRRSGARRCGRWPHMTGRRCPSSPALPPSPTAASRQTTATAGLAGRTQST